MKLEDAIYFLHPNGIRLDSDVKINSYGGVTKEDVVAALSYASKKSKFGIILFLTKINLKSKEDVLLHLYKEGLKKIDHYHFFKGMDETTTKKILDIISLFAYEDYIKNAGSSNPCPQCNGDCFIDIDVFTNQSGAEFDFETIKSTYKKTSNKNYFLKKKERLLCKKCNGKGSIRQSCLCNGRGVILDKKTFIKSNELRFNKCVRCKGRGYQRIKFSTILNSLQTILPIKKTTGYQQIKPLYEYIINQCYMAESCAEKNFSLAINDIDNK